MKGLLLTPLAFAAFTLAAQAQTDEQQSDTPTVESVTAPVSDRAQNPDMDELPADDEGLPDMDMEGMRTVDEDAIPEDGEFAPLDEGYTKEIDPADDTYEVSDEEMMAPGEADMDNPEGNYLDRDADGYDPVVDEVEQGAETAVKATGAAADKVDEEVGEEAGELFNEDTAVEEADMDNPEGEFIDRDADGYDPVVDEVEQGAETAVKSTGKAAEEVGEEASEIFTGTPDPDDAPEADVQTEDDESTTQKVIDNLEEGADTFGDEVKETYEEAKDEATELNTRGAASERPDETPDADPNR